MQNTKSSVIAVGLLQHKNIIGTKCGASLQHQRALRVNFFQIKKTNDVL